MNGGYAFLHIYVSLAAEAVAAGRPNYKLRCCGSRGLAVEMLSRDCLEEVKCEDGGNRWAPSGHLNKGGSSEVRGRV